MRFLGSIVAMLAVLFLMSTGLQAHDTEETLKGTIMCAKCTLKEGKTCVTVIRVKVKDKEVTYYLKDKGQKEPYHEEVCGGDKLPGTVVGVVHTKDGKKWVTTVKKVTYDNK